MNIRNSCLAPLFLLAAAACSPSAPDSAPTRDNVILIVADTLRADALGVYGAPPGASPEIDALAQTGLVVDRAIAAAPWTPPSMASLFTSTYPSVHGVIHSQADRSEFNVLSDRFVTLAEAFEREGYATAAVSSQGWVNPRLGYGQGFGDFDLVASIVDVNETERVILAAIEWISRPRSKPFFLFVNVLNPHDPYEPPPPFDEPALALGVPERILKLRGKGWRATSEFLIHGDEAGPGHVTPEELEYLRAMYAGEVRYVDWWIGVLRRRISQLGLTERTSLVLTSDHGESFLEHGQLHHISHLYNENLQVPFIVSNPARFSRPMRLAGPAETIDLYPTLLGMIGASPPPGIQGRNLLSDDPAVRVAYSEGHENRSMKLQDEAWSAILTPDAAGRPRLELYDLRDDPGELRDRAAAEPEIAGRYLDRIVERARANAVHPQRAKAARSTLDDASLEQLRALGYLR